MKPRDGIEAELPRLLERADLVKFARAEIGREEAREAGLALRAVVDHVEVRVNPESEVAKRIAAAKERAA
jgi:enoyl-CoA hydratase/carnithine racemase